MTANLDAAKLAKLLALAGSDHDGEALAALRKARRLLDAAGLSFTDAAQRIASPGVHTVRNRQSAAEVDRLQAENEQLKAAVASLMAGSMKRAELLGWCWSELARAEQVQWLDDLLATNLRPADRERVTRIRRDLWEQPHRGQTWTSADNRRINHLVASLVAKSREASQPPRQPE